MKFIPNNINAIIFDLGGVILNLDPQKTIDAFAEITRLPQPVLLKHRDNVIFKQYEKGEISSSEFRFGLTRLFKIKVANETLDTAWNAMLVGIPLHWLEMIGRLRPRYKTFVLSNTNEIHIAAFDKIVSDITGGRRINDFFDAVYYSYKVGMRKPDREIFEMVVNKNKLNLSSTLFIDDTLENIESANKLGLQTWHLTNQKELYTVLENG